MSYSYQFRLKMIKLVIEQDYGLCEVAKLHKNSHALVIYWLNAFRESGLDGEIALYNPSNPENSEAKDEKEKRSITALS